jgi:biopolymer transport protein ExbD
MPLKQARLRISDYNENRKRRLGSHEKKVRMVSLSLTSMVDMFAILVIFLLTNTSTVNQWVEVGHGIQLPKAKASDAPPKAATIQISTDQVFGDAEPLASTRQVLAGGPTVESVRRWLSKQKKDGYVNIVAHEKVPYGVIRRVISSCRDAGFQNVNLTVQPKS